MLLSASLFLWWIPLALAAVVLLGFSVTASMSYAVAGLILVPLGGLMAIAGITLALVHLNRNRQHKPDRKRATLRRVTTVITLHLLNFPLAIGFAWAGLNISMPATVSQSLSPDRAYVAETYFLDEDDTPAYGQAVRVRPYWTLIRKHASETVFSGECRSGPVLSWTENRTLAIRCPNAKSVSRRATTVTSAPDITITYSN
jgi:hypothetical protein